MDPAVAVVTPPASGRNAAAIDLDALVEDRAGEGIFRVRRDVFTDPAIFELELAHIFEGTFVYWVPAWRSESELVSDVRREVSLIYHTRRAELAERVLRIRSRKSVTAMPLPRTVHLVTNVLVDDADAHSMRGSAAWTVHEVDPRTAKQHTHFGRYEFELIALDDGWKIKRKKTILLNDRIPTVIDFYNL